MTAGIKNRGGQDHEGQVVDDGTADQVDEDDENHDEVPVKRQTADPVGGDHGNLGHGQEMAEDDGTRDKNEDHAGRSKRFLEGFHQSSEGEGPFGIRQDQHRRRPDAAGLRGREPPFHEPSDDHDEDDPDPEKLRGRLDPLFPGRSRRRWAMDGLILTQP